MSTAAHPLVMIVSGPAGSGKTTVCDRLREEFPSVHRMVTTTTRPPRPGEVDGVDYHFFSREHFDREIAEGGFFEYATIHGNHYGTLRQTFHQTLDDGFDLLLNIDVQGARSFQHATRDETRLQGGLFSVFIMPESLEVLRQRMLDRGQDDESAIDRRIETARQEMELAQFYDYNLVTTDRETDYDRVRAIYLAEKLRVRG